MKVLATGLAAGILLDATVIRALLVPAVVSLFGRWNWWLPRAAGAAAARRAVAGGGERRRAGPSGPALATASGSYGREPATKGSVPSASVRPLKPLACA